MRRLISRWKYSDLDEEAFREASVLHICSGTMFHLTALKTTQEAVRLAKKIGNTFVNGRKYPSTAVGK